MRSTLNVLFLATVLAAACSVGSPTPSTGDPQGGQGLCSDKCLKACGTDSECDVSDGELCCDFATDGKACMKAKDCPRLCTSDAKCDTAGGEACVRTTLASPKATCEKADDGLKFCSLDSECKTGHVCCGIYKEPVCLLPEKCPRTCTTGSECNTQNGEVCCTTLGLQDTTLGAPGLCVNPKTQACPNACTQSIDCDTKDGELCCQGVCQKTCEKTCSASSDCNAQICCLTPAAKSPFVRKIKDPGYNTTTGTGGTGGTGGATGGTGGTTGGTGGSGGATGGTGGSTGGSGGSGGATVDSGACTTCGKALQNMDYLGANVCAGAQRALFDTLKTCICSTGCTASCGTFCSSGTRDSTCDACIATTCATPYNACMGGP